MTPWRIGVSIKRYDKSAMIHHQNRNRPQSVKSCYVLLLSIEILSPSSHMFIVTVIHHFFVMGLDLDPELLRLSHSGLTALPHM